jgi:hypothetical protein
MTPEQQQQLTQQLNAMDQHLQQPPPAESQARGLMSQPQQAINLNSQWAQMLMAFLRQWLEAQQVQPTKG